MTERKDKTPTHKKPSALKQSHLTLVETAIDEVFEDEMPMPWEIEAVVGGRVGGAMADAGVVDAGTLVEGIEKDIKRIIDDREIVEVSTGGTTNEPVSFRNKYGLTAKQEAFAQAMLNGAPSQAEAYRKAYDTSGMKPSSVHRRACELMTNSKVRARLDAGFKVKEDQEQHTRVSLRDYVVERLTHEAEHATSDSARVQALTALGKTIAMFTDRVEDVKVDERTPDEIKTDLERMLVEMYGEVLP